MPKFTDSDGGTWEIRLSVGMLEKLRDEADFDLDEAMGNAAAIGGTFGQSPKVLGQLLWVLCEDQARQRGIEPRAFGLRLDRDTLDRATNAFFEAAVLFYPRSSAGRAIQGRLPELLAKMDAEIERKTVEMLDRELSPTATSSPGSPASIPSG